MPSYVYIDDRFLLGGSYGPAKITGTTTRLGIAGSHRVYLYRRDTGRLVATTRSDAAGTYSFPNLPLRSSAYFVVALDDSGNPVNAAVSDYVSSELP